MGLDRRAGSRSGRFRGARGGSGHSGAPGCGGGARAARRRAPAAGDRRVDQWHLGASRSSDCGSDRTRHRPGPPGQRGCAPATRPRAGDGRCRRCVARRSPPTDRSCRRRADLRLELSSLEGGPDADARSGPGAAQDPCLDQGRRAGRRLSRPATEARSFDTTRRPSSNPSRWLSNKATTSSSESEERRRRRRRWLLCMPPSSARQALSPMSGSRTSRRRSGSTSAKAPSASASRTTCPP